MTRKNFNSIAMHLAYVRPSESLTSFSTWLGCVRAMSDALKLGNPHFDRERFEDACRLWDVGIRDGALTVLDKRGA